MSWFGRVSQNVAELRIHFCPRSAESAGVREFLRTEYNLFRTLNPRCHFMARDAEGCPPVMYACPFGYFHKNSTNPVDFTKDIKVELSGLSASEVKAKLKEIVLLGDMKYLKRDEDDIIVGLDRLNPPSY